MTNISRTLKHLVIFPFCALLFFIGAVSVHAATYYVATTGSDDASCATATNISTPRQTIKQGMNCAAAGDTLYIRAGTYSESIKSASTKIPTGTSWANAPVISAYSGEKVTISQPSTENGFVSIMEFDSAYVQYVIFKNLILDGGYSNVRLLGTVHHIKFVNVEFKDAWHNCVQVGMDTAFSWFTGGSAHHCGVNPAPTSGYVFYMGGDDHIIEHMDIYDLRRFCLHIYQNDVTKVNRIIVRNNKVHNCASSQTSASGIVIKGAGHQVYNNIVYNSGAHGIITLGTTNAKIMNNTVYDISGIGLYIKAGSTGTVVRNNISYLTGTAFINEGTGSTVSHNLITDPSFVDAAAKDFTLQPSSPAIDAGVTLSQVTTDFKKTPRPQGLNYDIGAYEAGTGSEDTVPPIAPVGLSIN